jgi:threonine dehydratase
MTAVVTELIGSQDLEDAARSLAGVAVRTPLLHVDDLAAVLGFPCYVKPEMLQRGGAFKLRGAYNYLARMSPAQRAKGVVAPSSGNHAQAVALAARIFGVPAVVVMPTTVTAAKRAGAERLGARVELAGTTTADRYSRAQEIVASEGGTLVPPYDDPLIIAGQGTAGLEILDDLPDVGTVLVPVGGGGLSAGVATAVKLRRPDVEVVGVEPVGAPKLSRALAAGHPVKLEHTDSVADGLLAVEIGHLTFAHHRHYIDHVVLVPDQAMRDAVRYLLDRVKLVAEPSGAITLAALREGLVRSDRPVVAVLSGGNIEWPGLRNMLEPDRQHG